MKTQIAATVFVITGINGLTRCQNSHIKAEVCLVMPSTAAQLVM